MDIVSYAMGYANGQEGQSPVQRDIYDIANYPILHVGDAYLLERNESFRIRPNDVFSTSDSDPKYYHGSSLDDNYATPYDVIANVHEDNGTIRLTRDEYDNIVTYKDFGFIAIIDNNTVYYHYLNAYKTVSDYNNRSSITFEDRNDVIEFVYISRTPFILTDVDDSIIRSDSNYFDIDTETFVKGSTIPYHTMCKIFEPVLLNGFDSDSDSGILVFDESGYPSIADSITNTFDGDPIGRFSRFYDVKLIQTPNNQRLLWFNMINTV